MSLIDRIKWTSLGGYVVGVALLVAAFIKSDPGWLVAGVFLVVVALGLGRLRELAAGPFKAWFFQDFAKEVAAEAKRRPQHLERTVGDSVTGIDEAVVVVDTRSKSGQAQGSIVRPEDIAASRNEQELAKRVLNYYWQQTAASARRQPALRGLSQDRIHAEQDLFGAILELQTDLKRSGDLGTADASDWVIQQEIIRWWNEPESLTDEQVADLARRVRRLIAHRMKTQS